MSLWFLSHSSNIEHHQLLYEMQIVICPLLVLRRLRPLPAYALGITIEPFWCQHNWCIEAYHIAWQLFKLNFRFNDMCSPSEQTYHTCDTGHETTWFLLIYFVSVLPAKTKWDNYNCLLLASNAATFAFPVLFQPALCTKIMWAVDL